VAAADASRFAAALPGVTSGYCSDPADWFAICGGPPSIECAAGSAFCREGRCIVSDGAPCVARSIGSCDYDGNCAVARAFPLDTDQQCFAATSLPVACVDPDLSCPPVTTPALDGEGNCLLFGNCLPDGFARAPEGSACAAAAGTSTCAP
jgi:hypothetical protein